MALWANTTMLTTSNSPSNEKQLHPSIADMHGTQPQPIRGCVGVPAASQGNTIYDLSVHAYTALGTVRFERLCFLIHLRRFPWRASSWRSYLIFHRFSSFGRMARDSYGYSAVTYLCHGTVYAKTCSRPRD